ncbi:MAG: zinc ribbon domain-containing protein [Deltaproteobacteria bacterium]|nr:zinc ribbon domain-containing protein [Deltaproteobacteria bacterium]MBW1925487.1 zinc ribbon domain-containing protein [Deltaproteobacteria bacterium]MBW1950465.1 zinc ribbon domain-containing protein [Deltaproteobacteria bacterium]MBW2009964.1 zinc ribbon domain-containing protein [Deltaproteobacteria bacterium]MBW2104312.1 zinc ribbon domain-containing protein [Deltaproteobacteria bacterium]
MPIYEYECKACGDVFEHLLLHGETGEDVECPSCRGKDTRRRLSTFCSVSGSSGPGAASASSCRPSGGFS